LDNSSNIWSRLFASGKNGKQRYLVHIALFLLTVVTTIFAGTEWASAQAPPYQFSELMSKGLPYSISVLFILGVHEFGHYFASKYHRVNATLPYFIPFPPIAGFLNFGTMGAVIKTKEGIDNNLKMFDIGVAGPIAGFIASVVVLIYGFSNLPDVSYLLKIHPDYFSPSYGQGGIEISFGNTLLYSFLQNVFTSSNDFVPPMSEMYHYPYLISGWFGLLVTSMNLMPVGQLDGGHVIYSMFGPKVQENVAGVFMILLLTSGILGFVDSAFELGFTVGWSGWIFWAILLYFFVKIKHPTVPYFSPLNLKRKALGYFAIFIFIISFIPVPFFIAY
jgi:membrane-associated protease RseP (regulator of RpoE activity)